MPARPDPEAVQRKRDRNRASEIRTKLRDGLPITDEQRTFLASYDATNVGARGPAPSIPRLVDPPLETAAQPADGGGSPPGVGSEPAPGAPAASPDPLPEAAPPPPAPPRALDVPPPPPAVVGMAGDWRTKYGGGASGDELSRENVCLKGAELWQGVLIRMHEEIVESGGSPLFDPREASFARALVLACDDIIPPHVRISPKTHAVAVSSAILVQRAIRGKALKEKRDKKLSLERAADRLHAVAPPPPPVVDVKLDDGANGRAAPAGDASTVRAPDTVSSSPVREPDTRHDSPFAGKPFS